MRRSWKLTCRIDRRRSSLCPSASPTGPVQASTRSLGEGGRIQAPSASGSPDFLAHTRICSRHGAFSIHCLRPCIMPGDPLPTMGSHLPSLAILGVASSKRQRFSGKGWPRGAMSNVGDCLVRVQVHGSAQPSACSWKLTCVRSNMMLHLLLQSFSASNHFSLMLNAGYTNNYCRTLKLAIREHHTCSSQLGYAACNACTCASDIPSHFVQAWCDSTISTVMPEVCTALC